MTLLLPTSWFPPVSYFIRLLKNGEGLIELHETFPKQTIRNRTYIATAQGEFLLSVPLQSRSAKDKTCDIKVSYAEPWQTKHWRAIATAYGSSPYFIYYEERIRELIEQKQDFLYQLNHHILLECFKMLKASPAITFTENYAIETVGIDNRNWKPSAIKPYSQVFAERTGFLNDLSILDLIFNLGPRALDYLKEHDSI